jgi:hypothetical protein
MEGVKCANGRQPVLLIDGTLWAVCQLEISLEYNADLTRNRGSGPELTTLEGLGGRREQQRSL